MILSIYVNLLFKMVKLYYKYISLILVTFVLNFMILLYKPHPLKYKEITPSFISTHILDLEFNYVISNNCKDNIDIKAIQIVTSFAGNIEARSAQRRAYSHTELRQLGIYRVFLLALLKPGTSNVTQESILEENDKYNDIIQGNFLDDYRNLTYKHIMGIRWAVMECGAPLIIKMDDDIVADMYSLMEVIRSKIDTQFDLLGFLFSNTRPKRLKGRKFYVTKDEYGSNNYPLYVSGWLYILKNAAAKGILNALKSEKFFWIDDVFVTGVLAQKANLIHRDITEYLEVNPKYVKCCVRHKVKCGFIVGPSGGNNNIIVDFQRHSKKCRVRNCTEYNKKAFRHSCVYSRKSTSVKKKNA